mgnify:CR=1 FL=1
MSTNQKIEWHPDILGPMTHAQARALEKDGWRLPTRAELVELFDSGEFDPGMHWKRFWSSTPYAPSPAYAWLVDFLNGNTYPGIAKFSFYVRLVRSGQSRDLGGAA